MIWIFFILFYLAVSKIFLEFSQNWLILKSNPFEQQTTPLLLLINQIFLFFFQSMILPVIICHWHALTKLPYSSLYHLFPPALRKGMKVSDFIKSTLDITHQQHFLSDEGWKNLLPHNTTVILTHFSIKLI